MNLTAGLPAPSLRHHAGVLAQGPDEAAHIRDPPVEAGGLLHHVRFRVQGRLRLLEDGPVQRRFRHQLFPSNARTQPT